MNNTNSNFTLTIKTIRINYPSIFEHIADDNNTINVRKYVSNMVKAILLGFNFHV